MQPARRLYRRESEENRRSALIAATQELVAEGGPEAATVRAIAVFVPCDVTASVPA